MRRVSQLLSVLMTLHVGTLSVPPGPTAIPFRAQARRAAAEVALRASPALSSIGPRAAGGAQERAAQRDMDPSRTTRLRPEEWVGLFADRLDVRTARIVHAAAWLAAIPVRLDVRPGHFSMQLTLHNR